MTVMIDRSHVSVTPDPILDSATCITHDEINKVINSIKCNKTCGLDQIQNESIKQLSNEYIEL